MESISREDLEREIRRREVVVIDVMPTDQFRKSHIPGAINIPFEQVRELAPKMLPDKHAQIVTYCLNFTGRISDQAGRELIRLGYSNVRNYDEGKQDWINAGLPLEGEAPDEPIIGFRASANEEEARQKLKAAS